MYADKTFSTLPQEIIQAQSTNVDEVSEGTESSDGIMGAVQNTLNRAMM